MKLLRTLIALAAIAMMSSPIAVGQELPKATKHENASWYTNFYIKFKPNQADEAQKIIQQYFVPTDKAIGRDVIAFQCKSGRWDLVVFIPMADGAAELAWQMSPAEEKWFAAFAKIAGGPKKANEIWTRYFDCIADSERAIVIRQM